MTKKPHPFLPIAVRLRIGTPFVLHYKGLGEGVATFHDQQAAEAIETLYEALKCALNFIENQESDWNTTYESGDIARAALEKVRTMGEAPRSKKEAAE